MSLCLRVFVLNFILVPSSGRWHESGVRPPHSKAKFQIIFIDI
jgi:hypothetical protein